MIPHAMTVASAPRWRTSRPARATDADLARAVRIRPMAMPHAVPVTLLRSAAGIISSVIPGGCTIRKSR